MKTFQLFESENRKIMIINDDHSIDYSKKNVLAACNETARKYADMLGLHFHVDLVIYEWANYTCFAGCYTMAGGKYDKLIEQRAALTQ